MRIQDDYLPRENSRLKSVRVQVTKSLADSSADSPSKLELQRLSMNSMVTIHI